MGRTRRCPCLSRKAVSRLSAHPSQRHAPWWRQSRAKEAGYHANQRAIDQFNYSPAPPRAGLLTARVTCDALRLRIIDRHRARLVNPDVSVTNVTVRVL